MARISEDTVSADKGALQRPAPRSCRLTVVFPGAARAVHPLADATTTIGREPAPGALTIAHPTVSRQHAAIRWDAVAGRHVVHDLGSRNGTWLGGQRLRGLPRYIDDGAVLRIGEALAVYERRDAVIVDPPQVSRIELPGEALAMQALRAAIARAGADPSPVLVLGETGIGKERIAGELHRLSGRKGPLLAINCSALAPQLVESQLFGHARGAFTGATSEHLGLFRAATGGTLFLDELGELPLDLQPKLLRAVELGEVLAVGSTQRQRVDVRLIAATNRSLLAEVEAGRFRRDLYARLALWELHAPALYERRVDLLGWMDRLHRIWCEQRGLGEPPRLEFTAAAAELLLLAPWRDNLRGLQRCVHELAGRPAGAGPIAPADLPAWLHDAVAQASAEGRPTGRTPSPVPEDRPPRVDSPEVPAAMGRPGAAPPGPGHLGWVPVPGDMSPPGAPPHVPPDMSILAGAPRVPAAPSASSHVPADMSIPAPAAPPGLPRPAASSAPAHVPGDMSSPSTRAHLVPAAPAHVPTDMSYPPAGAPHLPASEASASPPRPPGAPVPGDTSRPGRTGVSADASAPASRPAAPPSGPAAAHLPAADVAGADRAPVAPGPASAGGPDAGPPPVPEDRPSLPGERLIPPDYRLQRAPRPRPSREELLAVLAANAWSIRATARHFERERKQISRWIEMYGLASEPRDDD